MPRLGQSLFITLVFCGVVLCWEYERLIPIYENEEWQEKHPALTAMLKRTDSALYSVKNGIKGRITGGLNATIHQFPYQVGLVVELATREAFCGGSLISNNYVLTASHCADMNVMITVLIGAHNVSEHTEDNRVIQLIHRNGILMHENYNSSGYQNDIALIRLNQAVQESQYIQIINLPRLSQKSEPFTNSLATVSGWGRFDDRIDLLSDILRFVEVSVMDNDACKAMFGDAVDSRSICSSGGNRVGPCGGDSGGPLVITDGEGVKIQVGLVSFGIGFGCALGWPTVYTRTTQFLDWISTNSDAMIRF